MSTVVPQTLPTDENVQKAIDEVQLWVGRLDQIRRSGLVHNVAVGPIFRIGFISHTRYRDNPIPGIDGFVAFFDYDFVLSIGRHLYAMAKSSIRAARRIRSWKGFFRRADETIVLYLMLSGFGVLLEKGSFTGGERKTLSVIEKAISLKLTKLGQILRESQYIERLRKTKKFQQWDRADMAWVFQN